MKRDTESECSNKKKKEKVLSSTRSLVIPPRIKLIISSGELYIYLRVDTAEDLSHSEFTAFIMCHVHDG